MDSDKMKRALEQLIDAARAVAEAMGEASEFDGDWCIDGDVGHPSHWHIDGRSIRFVCDQRSSPTAYSIEEAAANIRSGHWVRWPIPTEPAAVELPEGYGVGRLPSGDWYGMRWQNGTMVSFPPYAYRPTFAEALADAHAHAKGGKP